MNEVMCNSGEELTYKLGVGQYTCLTFGQYCFNTSRATLSNVTKINLQSNFYLGRKFGRTKWHVLSKEIRCITHALPGQQKLLRECNAGG